MATKYIAVDTTRLYSSATGNKAILHLLWGDRVEVLQAGASRAKVRARGKTGYVDKTALGETSLLEVYFIDVGQGDGVLIRTPDHRHIMIDGGFKRDSQPTGKNAADFIDWKFATDYGKEQIDLDLMLASHNDADHYGGLWDLLNVEENDELDAKEVRVGAFCHAGIGWWQKPGGGRWLGATTADGEFFTQLMTNRNQVLAALRDDADPKLQGEWAKFLACVTKTRQANGQPTSIRRLSHVDAFVPGFEGHDGQPTIRVLAPVEFEVEENGDRKAAVRRFGATDSWSTNGNSLLLRLDYGRTRILLTGDLNTRSQRLLLDDYTGQRQEFQCDVAKACHHGSDDVSYEFLSAMRPAVTIISSGDNEGHDHPRPGIVAASATTGYLSIADDRIVTPLVYSTELARSISLGCPTKLTFSGQVVERDGLDDVELEFAETKAGDLNPTTHTCRLSQTYVVAGLVYGLVNVRTDGNTILCATMNEKDYSWQIKKFQSRF